MTASVNCSALKVMEHLETLATFSSMPNMVTRTYLTKEHKDAHRQIAQWMEEAGLDVWQDEAGNQWGRLVSSQADAPIVILGSHSDTVVNAGKYDGTLGVLLAIEALAQLKDAKLPFHIDVVAFADEEGVRFGSTLLGSSAVAGRWDHEWEKLEDLDGVTLKQAMLDFGLVPDKIKSASRHNDNVKAYLEVHIEQGPVLESKDLAVGVVSGIAGAKRFIIDIKGMAGHAGTVPIELRQDALCASAQMITFIESFALNQSLVATVGKCNTLNGAVNVIPGEVSFSIDIRSQDQSLLDKSCDLLMQELKTIAEKRNVAFKAENIYQAKAVLCDEALSNTWCQVVEKVTSNKAYVLASGAGHDAMMMANIAPVAMLFLRCERGISHNPLESIKTEDVAIGLECFKQMILAIR